MLSREKLIKLTFKNIQMNVKRNLLLSLKFIFQCKQSDLENHLKKKQLIKKYYLSSRALLS